MRSNEKPQRQVAVSTGGALGLMRTLARELAPRIIRVNTTHPTGADNPMSNNGSGGTWREKNGELGNAMRDNLMPVEPMPMPMRAPGHQVGGSLVYWGQTHESRRETMQWADGLGHSLPSRWSPFSSRTCAYAPASKSWSGPDRGPDLRRTGRPTFSNTRRRREALWATPCSRTATVQLG